MAEQSAASGLPRRALESLVEYRKTYVGPVGLVNGKYVKSYSVGYALTYKGRRLVDCLKGLEIVDPTYTVRISKELIKLAVTRIMFTRGLDRKGQGGPQGLRGKAEGSA